MDLLYISPSTLPSRTANSVHVAWQAAALAREGAHVVLYAKRSARDRRELPRALEDAYGIDPEGLEFVTYFSQSPRADSAKIAALAVPAIAAGRRRGVVLSRNLYAAYALAVLRRRSIIFETHQLECGFRGRLQRAILTRPWVTTVVISNRLAGCLRDHLDVEPRRVLVLPDAAPDGIVPVPAGDRRRQLANSIPGLDRDWRLVCGYFGHLYRGRGIETILAMAAARPRDLFLIYGGTDVDVRRRREEAKSSNVRFAGHVPHPAAKRLMTLMDVLLMPYQAQVSIGVPDHDTARWMSPLKMFEYMAAGVPIISSHLPALADVLEDGVTGLLAHPERPAEWVAAIDRLASDADLARAIGARAHEKYRTEHTWSGRARRLLDAARAL